MPMPEFHQLVNEAKRDIQEINVGDLKKMQQGGEDFSLIDVRDKQDADKGMIPEAVNISRGMLEYKIGEVTTDKNRKIVLYCGGGSRSALAAQSLKKMGFTNVISLAGGYKGWKEST
jgi:rhodanese-related sulfurtransferase